MPPWVLLGRAAEPRSAWSGAVLSRARTLVEWAEQNPRQAFMAGIEPLAVETKLLLAGVPSFATLSRMRDLQTEACRRAEAREEELSRAPGRDLLGTLGTVFSIGSSAVIIVAALA